MIDLSARFLSAALLLALCPVLLASTCFKLVFVLSSLASRSPLIFRRGYRTIAHSRITLAALSRDLVLLAGGIFYTTSTLMVRRLLSISTRSTMAIAAMSPAGVNFCKDVSNFLL